MRTQFHREIARLMTQMRRLCSLSINQRLQVVGCSLHEYAVLFRLVVDAEVPQHELAYDAAIDPAAVSRLVRDMTRSGLVTTGIDPTDKRQRFVKLTSKGRALERTLSPVVDAALQPLMGGLSAAEEESFLRLLRKAYEHAVAANEEIESSQPRVSARPKGSDPGEPAAKAKKPARRKAG
jgi:DNA-binding MarR family transcriptional regulator